MLYYFWKLNPVRLFYGFELWSVCYKGVYLYITCLFCSFWLLNPLLLHSVLFSTPLRNQAWFFKVRPEHGLFCFFK